MSVALVDSASDTSDLATYSYAGRSLGTADANRQIFVCIQARSGTSSYTVGSVTIGGVAATVVVQYVSGGNLVAIAVANVPSGTTGTVAFTFSATAARSAIQLYRAVGTLTLHDTDSGQGTPPSVNLDVPNNGIVLACGVTTATTTVTWTGVTEDTDYQVESQITVTSGSTFLASSETGRTISPAFGTGSNRNLAAASWTLTVASTFTASAALTSQASTLASSVTFTAPSYTASAALTGAASTLSASGTVSLGLVSATIATDGDSITLVFNEAVTG